MAVFFSSGHNQAGTGWWSFFRRVQKASLFLCKAMGVYCKGGSDYLRPQSSFTADEMKSVMEREFKSLLSFPEIPQLGQATNSAGRVTHSRKIPVSFGRRAETKQLVHQRGSYSETFTYLLQNAQRGFYPRNWVVGSLCLFA